MNEMDRILEGLIRRTDAGKLRWQPAVERNEFLASVDAISVVVAELTNGGNLFHARYQLQILNDEGDTAEVIETESPLWEVPGDRRATPEQARQLDRLYVLARRSALNTQATLAKLAKALEA